MEGGATDDGIPFSQDKKEFSKKNVCINLYKYK